MQDIPKDSVAVRHTADSPEKSLFVRHGPARYWYAKLASRLGLLLVMREGSGARAIHSLIRTITVAP
jgi:hypothetical protein